jgi:ribosomal protein S27E
LKARRSGRPGSSPVKEKKKGSATPGTSTASQFMDILICPGCGSSNLVLEKEAVKCRECGRVFEHQKTIVDFRL